MARFELRLGSCSYPNNAVRSRRIIVAIFERIESRVADRGFGLQAGCAATHFQPGEANKGNSWVGPGEGLTARNEIRRTDRGTVLGRAKGKIG